MLSPGASNALLKTLEEPPDHVRFVLATTDPQKVLPTIRSRTQHFEFQLLSAQELETYVRWINNDADLDVDDEAIAWVVRQGRGSARDTLSALDQVVAAGGVVVRVEPVEQLFSALADHDSGTAILAVAEALAQGHDPRVLGKAFLDALRDTFLLSLDVDVPHLMAEDVAHFGGWAKRLGTPLLTRSMEAVGTALVDMRQAADPRVPLEVALVRLTAVSDGSIDSLVHRIEQLEQALANDAVAAPAAQGSGAGPASAPAAPTTAAPAPAATAPGDGDRSGPGERARGGTAESATTAPGGGGPAMARAALAKQREERAGGSAPDTGAGAPRRTPAADRPAASAPPTPPTPPAAASRSAPPVPPTPPGAAGSAPAAPAAPAPAALEPPAAAPTPPAPAETAPVAPAPPPAEAPEPVAEPASAPVAPAAEAPEPHPGPAPAASSGDMPTQDEIEAAFTDVVLEQLKGVVKAIYKTGQFVAVGDQGAVFALENTPTRDRAEKSRADVEAVLAAHFGRPVPLVVIDRADAPRYGGSAPPPPGRSSSGPGTVRQPGSPQTSADDPADPDADHEDPMTIDVDQLENADVAATGLDRLTRAFPGATLIEIDEESK